MLVEGWDIKARIAVRTDNDSGSASLHWTQHKDEYQMRVITPFGGGTHELIGRGNEVLLRTPENHISRAEDAGTLLRQRLGWWFPVSSLIYWVRGLPAPAFHVDTLLLDEENRLSALNQAGWSIRYKNYVEVDGHSMPGKFDLQNDRIRIRVSIREWNLP